MRGLYVDEGRGILQKLKKGMRVDIKMKKILFNEKYLEEDEHTPLE